MKIESLTHLLNYSVHPLIYLNILLTMPLMYVQEKILHVPTYFIVPVMLCLGFATMGPLVFYAVSQKYLYPADWKKRLRFLLVLSMIGSGISLSNTKAWLEGIFGKKSAFVRTPKFGITSNEKPQIVNNKNRYNHFKIDLVVILEFCTLGYITGTICYSIAQSKWIVLPYLLIYLSGFFYINFLSFSDYFKVLFYSNQNRKEIQQSSV